MIIVILNLQATPQFNRILQTIARLREEGKLYSSTIQQMMDYWIALEQIELEYLENGAVRVMAMKSLYRDFPLLPVRLSFMWTEAFRNRRESDRILSFGSTSQPRDSLRLV